MVKLRGYCVTIICRDNEISVISIFVQFVARFGGTKGSVAFSINATGPMAEPCTMLAFMGRGGR